MDNLEEMDRFLEKFNLPRLNKAEIEIMNNYMAIKWIIWKKWTDSLKSSIFQD